MKNKTDFVANYNKDMDAVFEMPSEKIICRNCILRKKVFIDGKEHSIGYKNMYCDKYGKDTGGKPLNILYSNGKCDFYKEQVTANEK